MLIEKKDDLKKSPLLTEIKIVFLTNAHYSS
jgi:hypothetical protein